MHKPSSIQPLAAQLSSSLRIISAEESLPLAAAVAMSRGVSRVVDTTWLDRIGIPVYASIRPDSDPRVLCVHAGKGFTHAEAKIGAYMEAIEFSFALPGRSLVSHSMSTPRTIVESFRGEVKPIDFCPRIGSALGACDQIAVVAGEEFATGRGAVLVPAELVYLPFQGIGGKSVYGASTNGLASGNSLEEATVHALAEVMERDVSSFYTLGAPSWLIDNASLSPRLSSMVERIERAGLQCFLRYCPNAFGLPHFTAYILEPLTGHYAPLAAAAGMGFHVNRETAAIRALAEAVQSRLTTIHGGRDDLIDKHFLSGSVGAEKSLTYLLRLRSQVLAEREVARFEDVPSAEICDIAAARACLCERLRSAGLRHAVRVVYTEPSYPFQVVRVVVPGAEFYDHSTRRVGPRLLDWFKKKRGK